MISSKERSKEKDLSLKNNESKSLNHDSKSNDSLSEDLCYIYSALKDKYYYMNQIYHLLIDDTRLCIKTENFLLNEEALIEGDLKILHSIELSLLTIKEKGRYTSDEKFQMQIDNYLKIIQVLKMYEERKIRDIAEIEFMYLSQENILRNYFGYETGGDGDKENQDLQTKSRHRVKEGKEAKYTKEEKANNDLIVTNQISINLASFDLVQNNTTEQIVTDDLLLKTQITKNNVMRESSNNLFNDFDSKKSNSQEYCPVSLTAYNRADNHSFHPASNNYTHANNDIPRSKSENKIADKNFTSFRNFIDNENAHDGLLDEGHDDRSRERDKEREDEKSRKKNKLKRKHSKKDFEEVPDEIKPKIKHSYNVPLNKNSSVQNLKTATSFKNTLENVRLTTGNGRNDNDENGPVMNLETKTKNYEEMIRNIRNLQNQKNNDFLKQVSEKKLVSVSSMPNLETKQNMQVNGEPKYKFSKESEKEREEGKKLNTYQKDSKRDIKKNGDSNKDKESQPQAQTLKPNEKLTKYLIQQQTGINKPGNSSTKQPVVSKSSTKKSNTTSLRTNDSKSKDKEKPNDVFYSKLNALKTKRESTSSLRKKNMSMSFIKQEPKKAINPNKSKAAIEVKQVDKTLLRKDISFGNMLVRPSNLSPKKIDYDMPEIAIYDSDEALKEQNNFNVISEKEKKEITSNRIDKKKILETRERNSGKSLTSVNTDPKQEVDNPIPKHKTKQDLDNLKRLEHLKKSLLRTGNDAKYTRDKMGSKDKYDYDVDRTQDDEKNPILSTMTRKIHFGEEEPTSGLKWTEETEGNQYNFQEKRNQRAIYSLSIQSNDSMSIINTLPRARDNESPDPKSRRVQDKEKKTITSLKSSPSTIYLDDDKEMSEERKKELEERRNSKKELLRIMKDENKKKKDSLKEKDQEILEKIQKTTEQEIENMKLKEKQIEREKTLEEVKLKAVEEQLNEQKSRLIAKEQEKIKQEQKLREINKELNDLKEKEQIVDSEIKTNSKEKEELLRKKKEETSKLEEINVVIQSEQNRLKEENTQLSKLRDEKKLLEDNIKKKREEQEGIRILEAKAVEDLKEVMKQKEETIAKEKAENEKLNNQIRQLLSDIEMEKIKGQGQTKKLEEDLEGLLRRRSVISRKTNEELTEKKKEIDNVMEDMKRIESSKQLEIEKFNKMQEDILRKKNEEQAKLDEIKRKNDELEQENKRVLEIQERRKLEELRLAELKKKREAEEERIKKEEEDEKERLEIERKKKAEKEKKEVEEKLEKEEKAKKEKEILLEKERQKQELAKKEKELEDQEKARLERLEQEKLKESKHLEISEKERTPIDEKSISYDNHDDFRISLNPLDRSGEVLETPPKSLLKKRSTRFDEPVTKTNTTNTNVGSNGKKVNFSPPMTHASQQSIEKKFEGFSVNTCSNSATAGQNNNLEDEDEIEDYDDSDDENKEDEMAKFTDCLNEVRKMALETDQYVQGMRKFNNALEAMCNDS